ncbi:TetR/AcrR family transcriptional regulator [Vibrio genomosp. F10]|uniref:TetR family transcriptional regulator n=2 Tax=Vibrio genomosp. F10 TaxID=723171 RepID=A0A1B9QY55_9VIBR|nr:TetR/AcrR family transcriptional regulator [Vibrio genomosp. F10]OCH75318.1 TetR family transcriptional regulator [Vibrio genomosp. F10]OEE36023.1 TetR family transcriptional regulator [Vibrio genomosp. F10 str. ZF-129]
MAKTAKFDRQDVVNKAMALYWEKGFHATSMRNLQDVIDMRPGSIYAAFGSKDELFKEALRHYKQNGLARLAHCREESETPIAALKLFMRQLILDTLSGSPSSLCMLAKTVAELTDENKELLDEARKSVIEMEKAIEKLIIEAQEIGEVDAQKSTAQLARHVQIQITGLRTYAKTHNGQAPLNEMIEDVFNHYPF